MTLPQFFIYSRWANGKRIKELNIETLIELINMFFNGEKEERLIKNEIKGTPLASITECESDFKRKVNNIKNIAIAKESLDKKYGKKGKYSFKDISLEIDRLDENKKLKYKVK